MTMTDFCVRKIMCVLNCKYACESNELKKKKIHDGMTNVQHLGYIDHHDGCIIIIIKTCETGS